MNSVIRLGQLLLTTAPERNGPPLLSEMLGGRQTDSRSRTANRDDGIRGRRRAILLRHNRSIPSRRERQRAGPHHSRRMQTVTECTVVEYTVAEYKVGSALLRHGARAS